MHPTQYIAHSEATVGDAHPHDGLEWHFMIGYGGFRLEEVDQLVDTERQAAANLRANVRAVSTETEDNGFPDTEAWTPDQVDALVEIGWWLHEIHGVPLEVCAAWDLPGIGYHTMWGAPSPWTPVVKTCPGAARILQWRTTVAPRILAGRPAPTPPEEPMTDTTPASRVEVVDPFKTVLDAYEHIAKPVTGQEPDAAGVAYWVQILAEAGLAVFVSSFAGAVFASVAAAAPPAG